jgi:hypothetical protein
VCGCAGSGAGTPCSTTLDVATGCAFAAPTLLTTPTAGPNQAVLASIAKRNASRQRPTANGARRCHGEVANDPDIRAVYHVAASETLPKDADSNLIFDVERRQERVVNQTAVHATHHPFGLLSGERDRTMAAVKPHQTSACGRQQLGGKMSRVLTRVLKEFLPVFSTAFECF